MNNSHLKAIAEAYGFKDNPILSNGDEVVISNSKGTPIVEGIVESVNEDSIQVVGEWWNNMEYSWTKV